MPCIVSHRLPLTRLVMVGGTDQGEWLQGLAEQAFRLDWG